MAIELRGKQVSGLSKRALGQLATGTFQFVAKRSKVAEAIDEVSHLNRQIVISCIGSLVLCLSGLGVWQAFKVRSPWILIASNSAAVALANKGKSASGKLGKAKELASVAGHARFEREKQEKIVAYFPEAAPVTIPSDLMGKSVILALMNLKVEAHWLGTISAPTFYRVKISPVGNVADGQLQRAASTLQVSLNTACPPIISPQQGYVAVDVLRPDRQFCKIESYLDLSLPNPSKLLFPLGVNVDGRLIEADLSDPNFCHVLVAGTTGSGKSEFLRAGIVSLMLRYTPEQVKVAVCDPKLVTFPEFDDAEFQPWMHGPVLKDSKQILEALEELQSEMQRRYKLLEEKRVKHLAEYNSKVSPSERMPRILFVIDEFYILISDGLKPKLEGVLKILGAAARAAGIHLILATQRPSYEVVTPLIRDNLPGRVCLSVPNATSAQIATGEEETGAEKLAGKGDLICNWGGSFQRLQSLYWDGHTRPAVQVKSAAVDVIEVVAEVVNEPQEAEIEAAPPLEPEPIDSVKAQYLRYRQHRAANLAPYKFYEAELKSASAANVAKFEAAMTPFFVEWIRELNQQEYIPDQMVSMIWNIKPADRAGGRKFAAKLEFVNEVLGVKADGSD